MHRATEHPLKAIQSDHTKTLQRNQNGILKNVQVSHKAGKRKQSKKKGALGYLSW